ncbi:MAG: KAP family NTPase, partial [Sneathiellales bacterium]|nr:KAP family NTPase [Sneathiellales bacterium]
KGFEDQSAGGLDRRVNAIQGGYCEPEGERCWVAGTYGTVLSTVNGGENWVDWDTQRAEDFESITFSPRTDKGFVIGSGQYIYETNKIYRTLKNRLDPRKGNVAAIIFSGSMYPQMLVSQSGEVVSFSRHGKSEKISYETITQAGVEIGSASYLSGNVIAFGGTKGQYFIINLDNKIKSDVQLVGERKITSLFFQQDGQIGWLVEQPSNPESEKPIIHQTVDGGESWSVLSYRHMPPPIVLFILAPVLMISLAILTIVWGAWKGNPKPVSGVEGIGTSDDPIGWQDKDHLKIKPLARSISRFLRNDKTIPPLTIAITGEWGKGKSSLMNLIAEDLKKYDAHPVWFNAWHHQKEKHLLAALLENIRNQAFPNWWRFSGLWLRMRLFLMRSLTDLKSLLAMLILVVALFALTTLGGNAAFSFESLILQLDVLSSIQVSDLWQNTTSTLISSKTGELALNSTSFLSFAYLLIRVAHNWKVVSFKPASLMTTVSRRAGIAQFKEQLGFRYHFKTEFSDICHAMRKTSRTGMVIMIDDLDRCRPESVLEVLEAVNFLVTAGPCIIFLGIDEPKVRNAVAYGFKDSVLKLDSEEEGDAAVEVDAKNLAEFAENYLKKLINIPVAVPALEEEGSREIGSSLSDGEVHLSPWPDRFRHVWRNSVDVGIALVIFLIIGFGGNEIYKSYTKINEGNQSQQAVKLQRDIEVIKTAPQSQGQMLSVNTRRPEISTVAVNPPSVGRGDLEDNSFELFGKIAVLLIALLLFIGIRRSSKEQDEKIEDTARFKDALSIWNPAVFASNPTPRDMKRYHNRLRFNAMRLRSFNAKWTWLDKIFNGEGPEEPEKIKIPEPTLVALGAVESFAPGLISGKEASENYNPDDFNAAVQEELKKMNGSISVKKNGSANAGDGTDILKDFEKHYPKLWPPKKEYFDEYQQLNKALD